MEIDIISRRVRELISNQSLMQMRLHDAEMRIARLLIRIEDLEAEKGRAPNAAVRPTSFR